MKSWVISGFIIIFILISLVSFIFYYTIRNPITDEQTMASKYVLDNSNIETILEIDFYHGTRAYQVVTGKDSSGEEWLVWFHHEDGIIMEKKKKDGLSFDEVRDFVNKELDPIKINHIRLGIENNLPVYEISYLDQEERYAYHYITFTDGTFVKRYSLRRD